MTSLTLHDDDGDGDDDDDDGDDDDDDDYNMMRYLSINYYYHMARLFVIPGDNPQFKTASIECKLLSSSMTHVMVTLQRLRSARATKSSRISLRVA